MLLQSKNAVTYGGGGAIGGAVARAFAREGAKVFLARRTLAKLDRVAREISAAGGMAEPAEVDALDEKAIGKHALAEVANFAAFVASDRASAMTGAIANLSCGSLVD
jgi:NAD(P)-dependent dehydrogenase (short-subunit alcohol dehydrogenase family)